MHHNKQVWTKAKQLIYESNAMNIKWINEKYKQS
jgi:cell division protein FtsL